MPVSLDKLLAGENGIELVSVTIVGQSLEMVLKDPEIIQYLKQSFGAASKEGYVPKNKKQGLTYRALLKHSAGVITVGFSAPEDPDGFQIAYPWDSLFGGDPIYYFVPLPEPRPPIISDVIAKMKRGKE